MTRLPLLDSFIGIAARTHAKWAYNRLVAAANDARRVQEAVLQRQVAASRSSRFGLDHGLPEVRSYADFIQRVPLQSYEDLRPYVERVMRGDTAALLGPEQRIHLFAMTSGTTDRPKYVPVTSMFLKAYRRGWNAFGFKAMLDHPDAFLRPILQVVSPMEVSRTPSGIPCGSISGFLAANQKRLVRRYYVTPRETASIEDADARYYTIMRFAVPSDVSWIVTASPATPVKLARVAAENADRLLRDIHDGTLHPPAEISGDVRRRLAERLRPDPAAAKRIGEMASKRGGFYPKDYWRLAFLANWTGGTLRLHLKDFATWFGDTPVRDIGLLATEGRVTVGLEDHDPRGVLDVESGFFEFIQEGDAGDPARALRCHELTPGTVYRVIMSTAAGFLRYDLDDRVRVHGFLGQAPILEFLHRGTHVSSVTGEKLTEWQVTTAMEKCCREMGVRLDSFVVAPQWGDPPHYRLYVEAAPRNPDRLADAFDRELSSLNVEYAAKRSSRRLGAVSVSTVAAGALAQFESRRREASKAAAEQYKPQFLLTEPGQDEEFSGITEGQSLSAAESALNSKTQCRGLSPTPKKHAAHEGDATVV